MGKRKRTSWGGLARKMAKLGNLLDVVATGEGQSQEEADQDIQKLEGVKTYPVHLTEHLLNPKRSLEVRLLASEKLILNVKAHWCSTEKGFLPPEVDSRNKEKIKTLLIKGLRESPKEVQKAVADVIVAIIPWEWPQNWERLMGTLLSYLREEKESVLHGGLLLLKRINFAPSDPDWPNNLVVVSSEMNRISAGESKYSTEIRCMALEVFSHVVMSLSHCGFNELFKHRLRPAVSLFCKTSTTSWKSVYSDDKLKTNILKVVVALIKHSPKYVGDYLANLLPLFWQTFIDSAEKYRANIVESVRTKPNEVDNTIEELVRAMLEFLRHFVSGQEMCLLSFYGYELADYEWINLQDSYVPTQALRGLITLMEVTDDQIELWKTDVEDLVRKEFGIFPNDGIRRATEDLIELVMRKKRTMASGLFKVITEYIQGRLTEVAKQIVGQSTVGQSSWRSHESLLLAFSLITEYIVPEKEGESLLFDDSTVFEYVILADLNNPESHPLLVGRCLCLGGKYGDMIPPDMASAFLEATVNRLRHSQPACVRICAARAAYLWYYDVSLENRNDKIRRSHIPAVFEGLSSVATDFGSARVVKLVLKGVAALMPINKTFADSVADRIYSLVEKALPEYCKVSADEHPCLDVLRNMLTNRKSVQLLKERLIPKLLDLMASTPSEMPNAGKVVVEITETLAKKPPAPLISPLIDTLLPAFCDFLARTDYSSSLSRGIGVLQAFLEEPLRRGMMQRDKDGRYRAQHIPRVIVLALKLKCQIRKACGILVSMMEGGWPDGETEESIEELLNALLSCMRDRESEDDHQKVLEVYAHLIHTQPNTVLNFLASSLSPEGEISALELVVSEGLCRGSYSFRGKESKTLKLAFGKILEYALSNLSSQLHRIVVRDNFQSTMNPLLVEIWDRATRNY